MAIIFGFDGNLLIKRCLLSTNEDYPQQWIIRRLNYFIVD